MAIRGQVKWFDPKKGFGFIVGPDGQDVFVHYSHIQTDGFRLLKDGEEVDYDLVEGEKGWQARTVLRLNVKAASDASEIVTRTNSEMQAGSSRTSPNA